MTDKIKLMFDELSKIQSWKAIFEMLSKLAPDKRGRVLEPGSCNGGGTFRLAEHFEEVIAIEGRDYHIKKAELVRNLLAILSLLVCLMLFIVSVFYIICQNPGNY